MDSQPFNPNDIEALRRRLAELEAVEQATLNGSGAITQGSGDALGERSVKTNDNSGSINTGLQVINHYYEASNKTLSKEEIARQIAGYLRWLQEDTANIKLRGIERAGGAPVVLLPLETAYVPLRAKADYGAEIALNQVLDLGNRLVIVGGPGSGKTTVLLHMAWALASSLLTGQIEPAYSRLGLTVNKPKPEKGKLPVPADELPLSLFVPLASYARHRRSLPPNAPPQHKTLAHFISHHLIGKQANFSLPTDFFVRLLEDGRNVILLLDGLDEVANQSERAEVRQSVDDLVGGRTSLRVVVTCRTIAYHDGRTALGANFREIAVLPLERERHIAPMVRQAYACIYPHDGVARHERSEDLLCGIDRLEQERQQRLGDKTDALVNSPLMVRLLLIVHVNNRTLPDERADLFNKAINALLQVDYGPEESVISELAADWEQRLDLAQYLAFQMHHQGPDQGREIEEAVLKRTLRQEADFLPHIDAFLRHARQRGSVLEERDGSYRFIHLAFQEFLVARYLREVVGAESRKAILASLDCHWDDPWWREPILLLVGYMGASTAAAKPTRDFISALAKAGQTADAQFSAAELAGSAALEWRKSGEDLRAECAGRIVMLLNNEEALKQSKPTLRARVGDRLAILGDPRFDPQRFYLPNDDTLGFVRIEADLAFNIGTRKQDAGRVTKIIGYQVPDKEINDTTTPTTEFYIARYPVTVAQFRTFVEATGFAVGDQRSLGDADNRPVRYVSWHEALAYCDWLNNALQSLPPSDFTSRLCNGPWRVTLPSELEWEKAARGGIALHV
jgi:formylglycine-generating enzyme required for sulfatase activity